MAKFGSDITVRAEWSAKEASDLIAAVDLVLQALDPEAPAVIVAVNHHATDRLVALREELKGVLRDARVLQ